MKSSMKKCVLKDLGKLQTLVGLAKGAYMNDLDPNRWEHVTVPLDEAFDICVRLRSKLDPNCEFNDGDL